MQADTSWYMGLFLSWTGLMILIYLWRKSHASFYIKFQGLFSKAIAKISSFLKLYLSLFKSEDNISFYHSLVNAPISQRDLKMTCRGLQKGSPNVLCMQILIISWLSFLLSEDIFSIRTTKQHRQDQISSGLFKNIEESSPELSQPVFT